MLRRTERDPRSPSLTGTDPADSTSGRTRPRLPRVVAAAALLLAALVALGGVAGPAAAAPAQEGARPHVQVIEVSGLLDRVLVDYVEHELGDAERTGALALVLQLNSKGAVVDQGRLDELTERIARSDVPVDVWVGPSGSRATGSATQLLAVARTVGVSPGSRVELTKELLGDRDLRGRAAVGDDLSAGDATELGVVDNRQPTIGLFLTSLDGFQSKLVKGDGGKAERRPITPTRFGQLPLTGQLLHTVASPPVAYLLFVIGLALLVFELYTAGVGVAGLVGAGSLALGCYGLAALPTRPVAVFLLLFAMFGYAVDVQTGVPRVWSGIATVSFVLGSVLLYDGLSLSWITLLVAIVGIGLAMVGGMPAMVRTRFSTPTIGREWMIGETGTATTAVAPDGVVSVRDAPWRAHTSRVTPIAEGDEIRVVAIDGLLLQVEPVDAEPAGRRGSH